MVTLTVMHTVMGALVLAAAVVVTLACYRLVLPAGIAAAVTDGAHTQTARQQAAL